MASKRVKNRLYWVAVKAEYANASHVISPRHVYRRALQGLPDRVILPYLEALEARYGPARLRDVNNSALWNARIRIDAIREAHEDISSDTLNMLARYTGDNTSC